MTTVTEIIQLHIAAATLCITQEGKCREIQKLLHYLMTHPDYLRNNPSFTDTVLERCRLWTNDPESAPILSTILAMQEVIAALKESVQ
jgi:hypothetical protein